jgi:hypothetical protein
MWVFLHAFTQSFGEMIFGALLNQGFGWVLAFLLFRIWFWKGVRIL